MEAATKSRVRVRAANRCEYCRIHQYHYAITFHVEHIIARQRHGSDDDLNLALACHFCNRYKGPNVSGLDPETGQLTRLFTPRSDVWNDHFRVRSGLVLGLTSVGRTTVDVLNMNHPDRVRTRIELEPETFV